MSLSKNFFDLDLDDEIVQEGTETGSMDFDFDDPETTEVDDKLSPDQVDEFHSKLKDELGQDDAPSENVTDTMPEIPEFHKEFIKSGEAEKFKNLSVGDEVGMTKIGRFFSLDEIPAEYKKVNDNIKNIKSPDGFIVKVIPVATADCDENGEMNDYIVLYEFQKKYQYGTLQTEPVVDLCMYARNVDDLMKSYEYWSKHQVVEKDTTPTEEPTAEEPATEEPVEEPAADDAGDLDLDAEPAEDTTEEVGDGNEEVTQESMFDSGFSNLRSGIANALKDTKYKVSNIVRGMLGKDMFTVSDDNTTTTIDSMGNGCKVVTRDGKGKMKVNFNNISLSEALRKLVELFKSPEHILEGAIIDPVFEELVVQEADDFEYFNRHASTLAKTWKTSQYPENHTKTVSDLVDEYRKYYETNFRIKKSILDKALDVISRRLTELFNKGYVCGGYFDGYKMIIFHKDWLNKEINQFRIKDNPAYLLYIETSTIPHAQLGVDVREDRYDYDGKKDLGSTRKLMETINNSTTQESYVQEADEPSDDDTVEEAIEKENAPDEEPRTEETVEEDLDMDFDFDFDAPTSTEDALADSETPEGDDLSTFGTDTSDIQNEYDPKEIEILNKLIAAEGEAINDYFDASKDSHDSNARRLYSDIGHEERFHMEQLLFQKAQFTGEKYEPRDPEVKKEYEELLQLGMDDATAMHAAIDKRAMENSGPSDEGMSEEILEYSTDNILSMLHTTSILMEAGMYAYYHRADNTAKQYGIILEAYVVQEEVMNTAKAPKELKGTPNPFALLLKGFRAAVSALSTLTANIREKSEMNRINRNSRMEWLKKNGITGLFKSGKYFYFYNDTDNAFNMVIPVQYVDLLYRLSVDIGKKCGVTVTPQGYHGTIKNPIKYNSIEDGMNKIRSLNMTKTKVIVTDQNKDALVNEFFGYSDKKINVKVWNEEANRAIYESNNVYNKLMCFAMITGKYAQVTDQIMEVMKGLQGNMNSIYYKDRNAYNKYVGYMETIVKTYIKISQAATSDLSEMLSLDKEGVKDVTATRDAGGKLPEGTEDRRTSGALGDNRSNKKYAKAKK